MVGLFALLCLSLLILSCHPELKYEQLDKIDRFNYEHIFNLISQDQRLEYLKMTKAERSVLVRQFWDARNPNPGEAYNPNKAENERRFRLANKYFGVEQTYFIPGWRTDRGKVLIRYGIPDEVLLMYNNLDPFRDRGRRTTLVQMENQHDAEEQNSYLLWRYHDPDFDFRFYKRGPNDYRLMSPLPGTWAYYRQEEYQDARPPELYKENQEHELKGSIDFYMNTKPPDTMSFVFNYTINKNDLDLGRSDSTKEECYLLRKRITVWKKNLVFKQEKDDLFIPKESKENVISGDYKIVLPRGSYKIRLTLRNGYGEGVKTYTIDFKENTLKALRLEEERFFIREKGGLIDNPSREYSMNDTLFLKYRLMNEETSNNNIKVTYVIQGANTLGVVDTFTKILTKEELGQDILFLYFIPRLPIDKYIIKIIFRDEKTEKILLEKDISFDLIKWKDDKEEKPSGR